MGIKAALAAVACLSLTACFATVDDSKVFWDKVRQVQVGMTREEVSAIVGAPHDVTYVGNVERRTYRYTAANGQANWVTIPMRDGKVVSVMANTPEGTIR